MSFYKFSFSNALTTHSVGVNSRGELVYNVVFLPENVVQDLPLKQYPRLRVEGEMNDVPFQGALQPATGQYYLLISRGFMRRHGLALGDMLDVRFNIADQDHVEMPPELQQALQENSEALALWSAFTPGKKRGFATQVGSAMKSETRTKRSQKMIGYILAGKNPAGR